MAQVAEITFSDGTTVWVKEHRDGHFSWESEVTERVVLMNDVAPFSEYVSGPDMGNALEIFVINAAQMANGIVTMTPEPPITVDEQGVDIIC